MKSKKVLAVTRLWWPVRSRLDSYTDRKEAVVVSLAFLVIALIMFAGAAIVMFDVQPGSNQVIITIWALLVLFLTGLGIVSLDLIRVTIVLYYRAR